MSYRSRQRGSRTRPAGAPVRYSLRATRGPEGDRVSSSVSVCPAGGGHAPPTSGEGALLAACVAGCGVLAWWAVVLAGPGLGWPGVAGVWLAASCGLWRALRDPGSLPVDRLTDVPLASGLAAGWLVLATATALLWGAWTVPALALTLGVAAALFTRGIPLGSEP